ncbi:MAG: AraC family transcriptional regulator, partial [Chloroflexi bacterium]|nr:AraC family transcriptional regulator [Chloroflexota bacterium]
MDEITIETIKQLHNVLNYNNPKHPLISIIDYTKVEICLAEPTTFSTGFYNILLKDNFGGELTYGRRRYDFTEGTLLFSAPGHSFTI